VNSLLALDRSYNDAIERQKKYEADRSLRRAELKALIAKGTESIRRVPLTALQKPLGAGTLSAEPGATTTGATGNYVSIDAGVALAYPTRGGTGEPWFLPYVGANISFAPVERVVPFDKLAGSDCSRFLQRVSLTAGFSLTTPALAGHTLESLLFDRYPFIAVGFRTTQYMRVTAGAFVYAVSDKDPATNDRHVAVAPFAGISLDLDMIHFITTGFAGVK
jgi:hypothetical protein